jgi:hypothetical protein
MPQAKSNADEQRIRALRRLAWQDDFFVQITLADIYRAANSLDQNYQDVQEAAVWLVVALANPEGYEPVARGGIDARVVLDAVKLEGFVTGLIAAQGARSVATHLHIGHAAEVGVEVTGAGLDLSNSVIDAGGIGVRLAGYVPGAPGDAPRIQDNEINARGIAGIYVADGTPGEARNNAIGVPPGRCIVGASHAGDFKERANLCHPL